MPCSAIPRSVRFYSFEGLRETAATRPTGKSPARPLQFVAVTGQGAESLQRIPGRWPDLTAVRLDRGSLLGQPLPGTEKTFTVEIWFRPHGPGALRGNNGATDGTLLSVGNGYWDGWRLTAAYPARSVGFEIGRPKPNSSVGIHGGLLPDGVWNHLAATWDGQEMRLYLNGAPAAQGDYRGAYTRPARGDALRIGFAGSGLGSLSLDVDEVAVYGRARTAAEILQSAYFYAPLPGAAAAQFVAAETDFRLRNYAAAAARYDALFRLPGLHADYRGLAHLGHARALRAQQQFATAAAELGRLCEDRAAADRHRQSALLETLALVEKTPGDALPPSVYEKLLAGPEISAGVQRMLHLDLARSLARAGDHAAAGAEYRKLLQSPPATAREGWDLRLEWARMLAAAGDAAAARAQYASVLAAARAPAQYKCDALFCIADSFVRQGDFTVAKAALGRLSALADVPPHYRAEAAERLDEIGRREAGLPPFDAAAHASAIAAVAEAGADAVRGPRRFRRRLRQPGAAVRHAGAGSRRNPRPQGPRGTAAGRRSGLSARGRISPQRQLPAHGPGLGRRRVAGRLPRLRRRDGATVRRRPPERFCAVDDPAILARLDPAVRGKVVEADLRGLGVRDFGQAAGGNQRADLYCNDRPMTLARWPSEGFVKMGELVGNRPFAYNSARTGNREGKFVYDGDRPSRWRGEPDIWLYGYWAWDWADGYQRVASIDTVGHVISLAPPNSPYGYRKGQRYYALNLLCELDRPGQWYLDRQTGRLYSTRRWIRPGQGRTLAGRHAGDAGGRRHGCRSRG